jgi:ribosome maturation protein SDO1
MQIGNVFVNVSKGEVAKAGDLQKAFGTSEVNDIVKEVRLYYFPSTHPNHTFVQILKKGEVQVGDKEREHDLTSLRKEIATLVAEKCVDPSTQTPYPVGMIEKAMAEAGFSVKQNKTAKSQVSECIKQLQNDSGLPIQRARMRVRVSMPTNDGKLLREKILEGAEKIENDKMSEEEWEAVST